ncbi:unnamed protein product, partial [marine sediment metagenome]
LAKLAKEQGLHRAALWHLHNGERKTYRGWRCEMP